MVVLVTLGLTVLVALTAGCATTRVGTIPLVPENLRTPATEVLSLKAEATGVQIYECNAGKDESTRFEWIFIGPKAFSHKTLLDSNSSSVTANSMWPGIFTTAIRCRRLTSAASASCPGQPEPLYADFF